MNSAAEQVIALLSKYGWESHGHTDSETVRISTMRAPVFGGIGGEVRTFGGRLRFKKASARCTVGNRTVNFYRVVNHQAVEFSNFKTRDVEGITKRLDTSGDDHDQ